MIIFYSLTAGAGGKKKKKKRVYRIWSGWLTFLVDDAWMCLHSPSSILYL